MLAILRRGLNTWIARLFFMLLVASFAAWGVGDVVRNIGGGDPSTVATVGSRKVAMPEAQFMYRRQLSQVVQMFGGKIEPTPEIKRAVAAQSVERLVNDAALDEFVQDQGIVVSDEALRQAVFDIPQFHGADGKFSRATFEAVMRNANLTEPGFLAEMRADIGRREVLEAIGAAVALPDRETRELFAFQREKRVADAVEFPFAAAPAPPAATEAQLQRWYDNHPDSYQTPEMRRIKAVVLSPETVAREITISDADLQAAYDQRRGEFQQPEKRTAQIVQAPDEAKAAALAAQWRAGADWAAMQAAAQAAGGSAIEVTDATPIEFPARELASAVFADAPQSITGPVKSPLAWHVVRVTKVIPGVNRTLEQTRDELRSHLLADKAADLLDAHAKTVEELLAAGTTLDDRLGELGLEPVTGTLDQSGRTPAGQPAPIPGPEELRTALIQAAFAMKPGDPARLTQAPAGADGTRSYFAVVVEDIRPAAARPLADVEGQVRADWTRDAIRHTEDEAAAKVLAAVKGGQTLADAALVAGVTLRRLPPVGRAEPVEGVPADLIKPLFGMQKGEATMLETPDGFLVAALAEVVDADPGQDPIGYAQMRDTFATQVSQDVQAAFAIAVRNRLRPRINRTAIDTIAQAN